MNFLDRPLAITDLELTGIDPALHEIIEFGLVLMDQCTLEILGEWETKVKPQHIKTANPESLAVAGFDERAWNNALALDDALDAYLRRAKGSVFAAWGAIDWMFLWRAMQEKNIDPKDYFYKHPKDLWSAAVEHFTGAIEQSGTEHPSLSWFSTQLGVPKEPEPHRAINGARAAALIYQKLAKLR